MITESGVPSALGIAHRGPRGRDQGDPSEQEAAAIDRDLMRVIKRTGMAGGVLFQWVDEWGSSPGTRSTRSSRPSGARSGATR